MLWWVKCSSQMETCSLDGSVTFLPLYIIWNGWKSPTSEPQKAAVIAHLSLAPATSTRWEPFNSIVHVLEETILTAVWSQFNISSAGISFISTVATISFKNCSSSLTKSAVECLLLAVVTFHLTNFIWFRKEYAQCLFNCTCPPNTTRLDRSQATRMLRAVATCVWQF